METRNKREKKSYSKKRGLLVTLLMVMMLLLGLSSYMTIKNYVDTQEVIPTLDYTNSSKIDYNVFLKDNEFISSKVLGANKTYIYELIDDITMTFEYNYAANKALPLDMQHKVIATIYGIYNDNPNGTNNPLIWEKEYTIKPVTKVKNEGTNNLTIKETFNIDINKYNDEAMTFKTKFSIPTLTYLEVKMPVIITGESKDFAINDNYVVMAKIPLTEKVVTIDAEIENSETKSELSLTSNPSTFDLRDNSIYIITFIISLILFLLAVKGISQLRKKSNFESYLLRLKKDYGEILIETNNMPDVTKFKPISITNFEEILNLSNSLNMPIMLYERETVACFYILKNEILYSFILNTNKGF